jgi:lipopolysaccharide/colanic/teichoic acid biosynthesis glycosyltransferase
MMQRCFDGIAATVGLLILSPLFLVLAFFVKLHDGGPVFHNSTRVGRGGKLFSMHKFRSMVMNADKIGIGLTMKKDPRVTPIGRTLRKYKLDEMPQLLNVIKGDMSLVGARPEDPRYVAQYTAEQRRILEYRPGITSPASLMYRNEEELLSGENAQQMYVEELLPKKLSVDLEYLDRRTVWSDIMLILRTIRRMV